MTKQFENVSSRYGAPMGRPTFGEVDPKKRLFKVRFVDDCYDDGGAYWGMPADLYCVRGDGFQAFTRAPDRVSAAIQLVCRP